MTSKVVKAKDGQPHKFSKSRTGCLLCKQKRLKCDETKPECLNCTSRNNQCPGYQTLYKWHVQCQGDGTEFDPKIRRKKKPLATSLANRSSDSDLLPEAATKARSDAAFTTVPASPVATFSVSDTHSSHSAHVDASAYEPIESLSCAIDLDGTNLSDAVALYGSPKLVGLLDTPHESTMLHHRSVSDSSKNSYSAQLDAMETPVLSQFGTEGCRKEAKYATGQPASQDARTLLHNFYRTTPTMPRSLVNHSTRLVEYYFSRISGIYSCFDSHLNPFQFLVKDTWNYSASTYYAIQSMAAAHLGNEMTYMRVQGVRFHRQAADLLKQELFASHFDCSKDAKPLLTLLLLGMSACWQQASDIGVRYLQIARRLTQARFTSADQNSRTACHQLSTFFEEAMVYWEMVSSFVTDELCSPSLDEQEHMWSLGADEQRKAPDSEVSAINTSLSVRLPHPWTGVSPESQMLLAEVGRLVRVTRTRNGTIGVLDSISYLETAFGLETKLLASEFPTYSITTDCGDVRTGQRDLISLAQVTRDCGLLEIYRTFPDVLQHRMRAESDINQNTAFDPSIPESSQSWLTAFAIRILRKLETIPDTSNVRCHQLLLLLIAAAELRFPLRDEETSCDDFELDMDIHWARQFARARLSSFAIQLPAQPVHVMIDLLNEVWRRMDSSLGNPNDDIFWMDVMIEKGLHTLMG